MTTETFQPTADSKTPHPRLPLLALAIAVLLGPSSVLLAEAGPTEKGDGVRTVILIRHGDYDHDDTRDPDVGRALVPLGVAQARLVSARLQGMPVEWSSLVSSTMTRARETARVIADDLGLPHQKTPILRECTPPTWREDIMADETAEDLAACVKQFDQAYAEYLVPSPDRHRNDIIVAHGNLIRYFLTKALGVDTESWLGMSIGNCSITEIRIFPDGHKKVLSFGDVGHIPPNLQTRTAPSKPRDLSVPGG